MSQGKQNEIKKIAALSAGIVVALGVAGWQIVGAMFPEKPGETPAVPGPQASTGAPAPGGGQVSSGAGAALAPGPSALPSGRPATRQELALLAEEQLSPAVDPFLPLTEMVLDQPKVPSPQAALARAGRPPGVTPGTASIPVRLDLPIPVLPPGVPGSPGAPGVASAAREEPEPKLVGTLLGEEPSAVFKTEAGVNIVPVGGRQGDWIVKAVRHGWARVTAKGRVRELTVNGISGEAPKRLRAAAPSRLDDAAPGIQTTVSRSGAPVATASAPPPLFSPAPFQELPPPFQVAEEDLLPPPSRGDSEAMPANLLPDPDPVIPETGGGQKDHAVPPTR